MGKMLAPDRQCRETEVAGRVYRGNRFDVTNPTHAAIMRSAGYIDPGPGGATKAAGYVCGDCGFRGFFRTCGRCGHTCHRP